MTTILTFIGELFAAAVLFSVLVCASFAIDRLINQRKD